MDITKKDRDRFWCKVDKDGKGGCWEWTASVGSTGYGAFCFEGKVFTANRFSWILHNGDIPKGFHVRHTCDNVRCVNPEHLSAVTPSECRVEGWEETVYRFLGYVEKTDNCWNWVGCLNAQRYGHFGVSGSVIRAHRFSWELYNAKKIPRGMYICHHCDNTKCVNPDHLFLGTQRDNMRDKANKGRGVSPVFIGEESGNSKLTDDEARCIRTLKRDFEFTCHELASMFGVGKTTAWNIANNKSWKHI